MKGSDKVSIKKDWKITVQKNVATADKFYVYFGDGGIDVSITITDLEYTIGNGGMNIMKTSTATYTTASTFEAIIVRPDKTSFKTAKMNVSNGVLLFKLTSELTDELKEVGVYKMQIHLYDAAANRITIPPVEFEVLPLIAYVEDNPTPPPPPTEKITITAKPEEVNLQGNSFEFLKGGSIVVTFKETHKLVVSVGTRGTGYYMISAMLSGASSQVAWNTDLKTYEFNGVKGDTITIRTDGAGWKGTIQ